ncbi:CopD family protein [bacterium M00.F.Ca.ET.228.01.1.1]|uniref:copper resistance D family protein n=1 Tax=Paraburkholderia phenoliruptrix TaxID=252970 RepID=UPI0010932CC4|nr:CopD family protein [Paraburkholderia phenoliruptrix]TGP45042.1 CopD family protein [bacterium M00.F.Ca.ET.228.01.1.1]TGS02925.1 CopD family protein [bacterium M00.F.Ca.ET.191.01.1.1]TGU06307.1 CopD family protein [bacterium M00.F.Ca.ET.155.01.1.1]MBW0448904.1 CopD family protein [Paraburkholderia phenoliruptrix]MBW9097881.1 CopD family protein [Paraburkholderia phenoliruptrix]
MNDGLLSVLRLAFVALQNISFTAVVGALLCDAWLARSTSRWQKRVSLHLLLTVRIGALATLLFSGMAFWIHCALMSESTLADAGPAVLSMLKTTGFGRASLAGAGFMLIVMMLSLAQSASPIRFKAAIGLALAGVALSRSHTGHPVDAGLLSLPVWVDWMHLLAISIWVGLVLVTTCVVLPRMFNAPGPDRDNNAAFVRSLSDAATLALVMLFVTGAYSGWRAVGTPGSLITSEYGQVLLLKLALVAVAAVLGGHNRFIEMPQLLAALTDAEPEAAARPLKRFAAVLRVESVVLAGVLVAAAVLVSSPLPGTT